MHDFIFLFSLVHCVYPVLQAIKALIAVDTVDENDRVDALPVYIQQVLSAVIACTVIQAHRDVKLCVVMIQADLQISRFLMHKFLI